jgi:membrane protein DedA with SNARE-associated domain
MQDAVACFIWSLTVFAGFYKLLSKVEDVVPLLKKFNLIIFSILGLSIIGFVWYKQIKRRRFST